MLSKLPKVTQLECPSPLCSVLHPLLLLAPELMLPNKPGEKLHVWTQAAGPLRGLGSIHLKAKSFLRCNHFVNMCRKRFHFYRTSHISKPFLEPRINIEPHDHPGSGVRAGIAISVFQMGEKVKKCCTPFPR